MLGIVLIIALACWSLFGNGPRFLRWPSIIVLLLMTSGHPIGGIVGAYVGAFAAPVLTLLIMLCGIMIILRGSGWRPRRRDYREGGRFYDRW